VFAVTAGPTANVMVKVQHGFDRQSGDFVSVPESGCDDRPGKLLKQGAAAYAAAQF
jgi:hypothetical protein